MSENAVAVVGDFKFLYKYFSKFLNNLTVNGKYSGDLLVITSRFNPTFMELLFGSGPLNFGQLYGEVVVNDPESFLLPHSSILSFVVFLGIIPMVLLFLFFIIQLFQNKRNHEFIIFVTFIFVNLIKNDSLNYIVTFIFYSILYLILKNKNRLTIFK